MHLLSLYRCDAQHAAAGDLLDCLDRHYERLAADSFLISALNRLNSTFSLGRYRDEDRPSIGPRHIGDFCRWKDHDAYQKAFARLLRDLKAESAEASE